MRERIFLLLTNEKNEAMINTWCYKDIYDEYVGSDNPFGWMSKRQLDHALEALGNDFMSHTKVEQTNRLRRLDAPKCDGQKLRLDPNAMREVRRRLRLDCDKLVKDMGIRYYQAKGLLDSNKYDFRLLLLLCSVYDIDLGEFILSESGEHPKLVLPDADEHISRPDDVEVDREPMLSQPVDYMPKRNYRPGEIKQRMKDEGLFGYLPFHQFASMNFHWHVSNLYYKLSGKKSKDFTREELATLKRAILDFSTHIAVVANSI